MPSTVSEVNEVLLRELELADDENHGVKSSTFTE